MQKMKYGHLVIHSYISTPFLKSLQKSAGEEQVKFLRGRE